MLSYSNLNTDKVAQALHEATTLLKVVEALGGVREKLSQDATALAQQVAQTGK